MKLNRLVAKEIAYRKLNFILGLVAVVMAVSVFVGTRSMMIGHDIRTEEIIELKEAETREKMVQLEDDYRIIMRRLGYNALILHEDEDFEEVRRRGHPVVFMPEKSAQELGESGTVYLNHLLPFIQYMIYWPERNKNILVSGISKQVPVYSKARHLTDEGGYRSPITPPLPHGKVDLGYDIALAMNLSEGSQVRIRGEEFQVNKIYPHRGNHDDVTVWVPLHKVQQWLGRQGQINGILALQCVCPETEDLLLAIRQDVRSVIPYAQVIEFASIAAVRTQARKRAAEAHEAAIDAEIRNRLQLREAREQLFNIVVPAVVFVSVLWVIILTFLNVRERQAEIGILRALGFRSRQILHIFLLRAFITGLLGGLLGYLAGVMSGAFLSGAAPFGRETFFEFQLFAAVLVLTPFFTLLASWLPSVNAAMQDPASILKED